MRISIRALAAAAALLAVALLVGCGGDEGGGTGGGTDEGRGLIEAFEAEADSALQQAGVELPTGPGPATMLGDCFILDQSGLETLAKEVGVDDLTVGITVIEGPAEVENLQCFFPPEGLKELALAGVFAGKTPLSPQEFREQIIRNRKGGDDIEGEATGLDPDKVVAIRDEETGVYAWVDDGFYVSITSPHNDPQLGFETLAVAVEQVQQTLDG